VTTALSLPASYVDHLTRPRNRGDLEPADATGEAGTPLVGAGVRLTLRFRRRWLRRPRIAAAGFVALGGPAPVAPASWLTERLVGKTAAEALAIGLEEVVDGLGGPPARVVDAARLVLSALAEALAGREGPRGADPGLLVCRCFLVGDLRIRRAVRAGAADVSAVSDATTAGRGCHSCWPDLRALLDDERAAPAAPAIEAPPVVRVIDAVVRPLWRAQGVRLGRAAAEGAAVRLEVAAVEPDALLSPVGAIAVATRALREVVSDEVRVSPW
jgi:NifU-like protein